MQSYEIIALMPPEPFAMDDITPTICINNHGTVACSVSLNNQRTAFLYDGIGMRAIDVLRPYNAVVQDINDLGYIVGYIAPDQANQIRARSFVLLGDQLSILDDHNESDCCAIAINNQGHILILRDGWESSIFKDGKLHTLDPSGTYRLQAKNINEDDQVVGVGYIRGQRPRSGGAFFYSNKAVTFVPKLSFGTSGESISAAHALNNNGHIVGVSSNINGARHAFQFSNDVIYDLGALDSEWSSALAINSNGDIVGYSSKPHDSKSYSQALLWQNRTPVNLNDYTRGTGWNLKMAIDINDKGQIVGWGTLNEALSIFVMNPIK